MDARQVHAVMAAGLSNPTLLERWRRMPELLSEVEVDPEHVDLGVLWKFAGLSLKIRYNPCRADLPFTFRLLRMAELEIEVFANFAERAAELRRAGKNGAHDKMVALVDFVRDWHDPQDRRHVLLWDLIRHEYALAELNRAACAGLVPFDPPQLTSKPNTDSVPFIRGSLYLNQTQFDPRLVTAELRRQSPQLEALKSSPICLGYWLDSQSNISILEADELIYEVLALIDGSTTTSGITAHLQARGAPVSPDKVLSALSKLRDVRVIAFLDAPCI